MVLTPTDLPEPVVPATQKVRHFGEVGIDVAATDVFTERNGEGAFGIAEFVGVDEFAEVDDFAGGVRHFDADGIAAGNNGNAHRNGAHGAGQYRRPVR